jgi:protein ImuB
MRQVRPPETTTVTLQNQQPTRFYFRSARYTVERAYGPWLASGDWWNQALWGVEQWDVAARAQDGSVLCGCLVRDLLQNLWQMVALYD